MTELINNYPVDASIQGFVSPGARFSQAELPYVEKINKAFQELHAGRGITDDVSEVNVQKKPKAFGKKLRQSFAFFCKNKTEKADREMKTRSELPSPPNSDQNIDAADSASMIKKGKKSFSFFSLAKRSSLTLAESELPGPTDAENSVSDQGATEEKVPQPRKKTLWSFLKKTAKASPSEIKTQKKENGFVQFFKKFKIGRKAGNASCA